MASFMKIFLQSRKGSFYWREEVKKYDREGRDGWHVYITRLTSFTFKMSLFHVVVGIDKLRILNYTTL